MKISKKFVIILVVLLLVAIGGAWLINNNDSIAYSCIYETGSNQARCLTVEAGKPVLGCYGSYTLSGQNITDGIEVSGNGGATCENISSEIKYKFNNRGEYLSSVQQKED